MESEEQKTESNIIILPEDSTISTITEIYSSLKDKIERQKDFIIDASKVTQITTPFLQLIIALHKTLSEINGGKLEIKNPSTQFKQVINDLGLSEQLNIWSN
ncbi:MAG: lipid asymmetry maintenance protein MlaB [Alphaproteobacteria bacterium]